MNHTPQEKPMDDETLKAAIEAQFLMGHCVPSAHVALDRTTITDYSWDVDQARQHLHVPLNAVWDQRVLALDMYGLASFRLYAAPVTWDDEGNEHEMPGWQDEPREQWGSVSIHPRGVLRLATLYGRPYVTCEESPALLAHWQLVQAEAAAREAALTTAAAAGADAIAAHEAQWAREYPEKYARWQAHLEAHRRRWEQE